MLLRRYLECLRCLVCSLLLWISPCSSAETRDEINVYFGAGCFWHVQKVINQAEEELLGRRGANITGITGYAGGMDNSGEICYTNYGAKGHTEVVSINVPRDVLGNLSRVVWSSLFADGERRDSANKGAEYRAAVGFPGGIAGSPDILETIGSAQGTNAAVLEAGVGDDDDTFGKMLVYVYDSAAFPFHQAELYHQFHDFRGQYRQQLVDGGRLRELDCPSEWIALLMSPIVLVILCVLSLCVCIGGCTAWIRRQRTGNGLCSAQIRKFFPASPE